MTISPMPKLARQYKIARRTVRQALAVLEDEQLIRVIPRHGTASSSRPPLTAAPGTSPPPYTRAPARTQ